MNRTTKRILAVGLPLTLVVATGAAMAYWTGSGSGTGTATSTTGVTALGASQNGLSGLAPGVLAKVISGTVSNSTGEAAYVTTVTASIASVTPIGTGACDASDYTLVGPAMSVGKDLAPGASTPFSGATLAFNNKTTNQDGCKGATVNLAYAVS